MTENTGTSTSVLDPLDQNPDDIDLSYPILPGANYEMVCTAAEVGPNKKKQEDPSQDGAGDTLTTTWENVNEEKTEKGEMVPPGKISLKQYTGITELPKSSARKSAYTSADIAKNITFITRALGLKVSARSIISNPEQLVGGKCVRKVAVAKETAEFPRKNELKGFVIEG